MEGGGGSVFALASVLQKNRIVLLKRKKQSLSHENRNPKTLLFVDPENEIFHAITSEISKLRHFVNFRYCQRTKITIFINFRVF